MSDFSQMIVDKFPWYAVFGIIILLLAISFGLVGFLTMAVCWCFGLTFTWKIGLGVWIALLLLGGFKNGR